MSADAVGSWHSILTGLTCQKNSVLSVMEDPTAFTDLSEAENFDGRGDVDNFAS